MFDLNPGIDGASYIGINNIEGEIFFNANDGIGFQAYKFIDGTTVEQITFSTAFVAGVSAAWGNAIYYSEQTFDAVLSTYTFSLKKAFWNGIDYDYSVIKDVGVGIGYQCFWGAPMIKWNKLFLSEVIIDYQQLFPNTYRVISVTDTDVATTLHDTVTIENSTVNIFEWNNDVYFYLSSQNEIYRSQDGLTFSVEETLKRGAINVEVDIQSHYQLLTVEGKNIQYGAFTQGVNSLQFGEGEGMASGTYLLVINNAPYRIVIE
jgi:hypothetical protein